MDEVSALTYVFLVVLVLLSAFFSGSETAFSTVNRIRMKNLALDGNKKAKKVLKVCEDYDSALSAILIGNNIVNIASASVGTVLFTYYFGVNGTWISTLVMTLVVLTFGEVVPKSLAKENAEKYALVVVDILAFLMKLFWPLIFLLLQVRKLISKERKGSDALTEQELKYIIEESHHEGVLEEQERELVQSALDFDEILVEEILIPRVDVVAIDIHEDVEKVKTLFFEEGYSRLPVYNGTIDNVLGVLHYKDFFEAYLKDSKVQLHALLQKVMYIPQKKSISELMQELQKQKSHMAVVIDHYGGTIGIVTLEDIIEELVGDIWDESDEEELLCQKLSETQYRVSGDLGIEDFFDEIELSYRASEMEEMPTTMAGWVLETLERIPVAGDSFDYRHLKVTVQEVVDQRIVTLFVTVQPQPKEGDAE